MSTHVALLRGINLGRRRVKMPELRELLSANGHDNVRTLLQSGNVVLESSKKPERLERELEEQLASGLGFRVDVFVRTRDELADVLDRNPLDSATAEPAKYLVTFLRAKLDGAVARRLRSLDLEPERLLVSGREIYSWHPSGLGRSELVKHLSDRSLGVSATGRNWSTVTKLLELADA